MSNDQYMQRNADEIDEIRGRHAKNGDPADPHCDFCSDASYPMWPCDTAVLLAELEAATARAERAEAAMRSVMAWAEDRGYLDPGGHEDDGPSDDLWAAMFVALRAYRAALAEGA